MGGNIYVLLARKCNQENQSWLAVEYCSKAKDAFDTIKSGSLPHERGDLFTIVSIDYISDIIEKARFLWISNGEKIIQAPNTHIFMGDKTWLQFWEGVDSTAENMFQACFPIDRKTISKATCECIRLSAATISQKNKKWLNDSIECVLNSGDVEKMISLGNEIMIDVALPEYEAVYSVIKLLNTVDSISPHYEAHVAVTNAAASSEKQEESYREMAAIIRDHIPLYRLILDTIDFV